MYDFVSEREKGQSGNVVEYFSNQEMRSFTEKQKALLKKK